jgi:hypothetical protein
MAHAWKACWAQALEGSNPSPSAKSRALPLQGFSFADDSVFERQCPEGIGRL